MHGDAHGYPSSRELEAEEYKASLGYQPCFKTTTYTPHTHTVQVYHKCLISVVADTIRGDVAAK